MITCPVSSSVPARNVGSSSCNFCKAVDILSWSAFDFGSTESWITGSGNSIDSRITSFFSSHNVSPVVVSLRPTAAAISPAYTSAISLRVLACICRIRPTRSRLPLVEFLTYEPDDKIPEYTRKKVSFPTNGSVITLKARAENGSSSEECLSTSSSVSGLTPLIAGTSNGDGKYSTTASSIGCTPLYLNADPHTTGKNSTDNVALRIAALSSSIVISSPPKYFSMKSSSNSATASISFSRYSSA